jgi:hypothetical protein
MKAITKVLLVGAVAVMAIAVSAAPSEAKKHHMKGPKAGTYVGQVCSMGCNKKTNACKVMMWGGDKKWSAASFPTCTSPACPAAC